MLNGFGGASKSHGINGRLTSVSLIGGIDCLPGLTPDLTVRGGAKIKKTLCVKGSTTLNNVTINKDVTVKGNVLVEKDIVAQGNVCVAGELHSKDVEITNIFAFNLSANVQIPPINLNPHTVQILKLPCFGNIQSVDIVTGNITYAPNNSNPYLDVFQYSILDDKCNIVRKVNQFVCQKGPSIIPPMLNNICHDFQTFGTGSPVNFDLTLSGMAGTYPIDWSTLTFISISTYIDDDICNPKMCGAMVPYGTTNSTNYGPAIVTSFTSNSIVLHWPPLVMTPTLNITFSHNNAGLLTYTIDYLFENQNIAYKIGLQVSDTHGNLSNVSMLQWLTWQGC